MQSRTVASVAQRPPARRCSRTGSLSGALQAQQRWPAARWYAAAVPASGTRDVLPVGGAGRAPGGTVHVFFGAMLGDLAHLGRALLNHR